MPSHIPPGRTPDVTHSDLTEIIDFSQVRAWPRRREAPGCDAADLLLLDTAAAWFAAGHSTEDLVVLDDRWGALTLALSAFAPGQVRTASDGVIAEKALEANARALGVAAPAPGQIDAELFRGAQMILLPLPRSQEALEDWAWMIAEYAADDVVLLAGGRDKHMSRSMNAVLQRHFDDVVPGRGRSKARVLTARSPRRGLPAPFPRRARREAGLEAPIELVSLGAAYGGTKLDHGTRFLLEVLAQQPDFPTVSDQHGSDQRLPQRAVDLGCGNGTISVWTALRHPQLSVLAADQSASAVASTELTARANGVADRVSTLRDDALSSLPDASEDLILLNPPFHQGNAVDTSVAHRLISDSARVLRPGGVLCTVWNSHLKYRPWLERRVGATEQLAKNPTFTVTRSVRRSS